MLLRCVSWLIALVLAGSNAWAQTFGPVSPEGQPARQQQWLVPSVQADIPAHALLYRPAGEGPFALALIAHASTQNALRRAQMPQPSYTALARELVARGYAVLVPERLGHGRTEGPYLEDQGDCADPDYEHAGRATAAQILRALTYMRGQPFVARGGAVVIGHSAGGWGALALTNQPDQVVSKIVAFAPGRGGHADDLPGRVCAADQLRAAASAFGSKARVPVVWLIAANDSYFPPALSRQLADAFSRAGGHVDFQLLPSYGNDGHWMAEQASGVEAASVALARALAKPQGRRSAGRMPAN